MKRYEIVKTIIMEKGNIDRDFQNSLREKLLKRIEKRNNFIYSFNMKKLILTFLLLFVLLGGVYLGYTLLREEKPIETDTDKDNNQNTGVANPASTNCIEKGGTLKIEDQVGYCYFDDGSNCEEWSFFRGECKKGDNK